MADELTVPRTSIAAIVPSTVEQVDAFAERLIRGNYPIPAWIREKAKDPTAMVSTMILRGLSLGMEPFTALESFYEVKGRLGLYSSAMAARVLSSGVCAKWKVSVAKVTVDGKADMVATVEYQRKGMEPTSASFSWADAVQAGYTKQNAKYQSDPKAMLKARAIAIACREGFPDVLRGMNYAAEEIEDFREADVLPPKEEMPKAGEAAQEKVARKPRAKKPEEPPPTLPVVDTTFTPPEAVPTEGEDPVSDLFDPDSMAP